MRRKETVGYENKINGIFFKDTIILKLIKLYLIIYNQLEKYINIKEINRSMNSPQLFKFGTSIMLM